MSKSPVEHESPSVAAGHELTDFEPRGVIWLAVAIVVGVSVSQVFLWLLLSWFQATADSRNPEISPLAEESAMPPEPHLQSAPAEDYQDFLRQQEMQLGSYGWISRKQGVVHVPIERAIELTIERGLPKPAVSSTSREQDASAVRSQEGRLNEIDILEGGVQ